MKPLIVFAGMVFMGAWVVAMFWLADQVGRRFGECIGALTAVVMFAALMAIFSMGAA